MPIPPNEADGPQSLAEESDSTPTRTPTRTHIHPSDGNEVESVEIPICGAPCHYGGLSAARKYSKTDLGWMWHCNRRVKTSGERCHQHRPIGT